jgi:hypothetical protein
MDPPFSGHLEKEACLLNTAHDEFKPVFVKSSFSRLAGLCSNFVCKIPK